MNEIILNAPKITVKRVENVDPEKYYGTFCSTNGKGFVTREKYKDGDYKILSNNGVTYGNGYDYDDILLSACLRKFLQSASGRQVFEFDTAKELFAWLAE